MSEQERKEIPWDKMKGTYMVTKPLEPTRDVAAGMVSLVIVLILLTLSVSLYAHMPNWWLKFLAFIPLSIATVGIGAMYEEFRLKIREPREK